MDTRSHHTRSNKDSLCDFINRLKWRKPSFLGGVAITMYVTSLLLYVIAISTNHWIEIASSGPRVNAGIWSACMIGTDEVETCSSQLFHTHLVKRANHWHTIPQWLMATGLVVWFCEEFAIIALVLLKTSPDWQDLLVGVNVILGAITVICLFLTVLIIGSEAGDIPNAAFSWSFSVAILSLILVAVTVALSAVTIRINNKGRLLCLNSTQT